MHKNIDLILFIVSLMGQLSLGEVKSSAQVAIKFPNNFRTLGKISKLFPIKKSRVWKISKQSIGAENELNYLNETEPLFVREASDFAKEFNNAADQVAEIREKLNGSGELSTWTDLNNALGEDKIKDFLNGLPLHVLRNITSLTKINPKFGEKKLIELFMEQNKITEVRFELFYCLSTPGFRFIATICNI